MKRSKTDPITFQSAIALALPDWHISLDTPVIDGVIWYRAMARRCRITIDHSMIETTVSGQRHKTATETLVFLRGALLGGAHLTTFEKSKLNKVTL